MALTQCSECGGKVSDQAAACPHCGAPRLAEDGTVIRAQQPDTPPARKRSSRATLLFAVLLVLIALAFIGRAINPGSGSSNSRSDPDFTAKYGAREIVKEFLKAPSTASFVSTTILERTTAGYCLVRVVVDAENSFGAKIRSTFTVILRLVGDDYSYKPKLAAVEQESTGENLELFKVVNGWK